MKDLKFNIVLNDRYSSKMRSIASKTDRSFSSIRRSIRKTGMAGSSLDSLNNKLNFLEKKRSISVDFKEMKRLSREIKTVGKEIDLVEKKGGIRKGGSSLIGKAGGMIAGAGIAYGALRLGGDVVKTTAKYERFEAVLKNTYGSSLKAKRSMADLQNFASKTPFQIDELTDSFIKLTNAGLNPTMSDMTSLGDVAASQGKTFGQLSEALLDAQMGEFERLKEFGIKGSTKGKTYKFTFKGETKEIEKSGAAVKAYILSLGKLKGVQGGMNAISLTTGGTISNLADNWDQLQNVIGSANSGPVKDAIGGLSSIISKVKDYMSVPLSQKMREEKAGTNALVTQITSYNTNSDERNRLITQLQQQYPDFLGNLDAETATNDQLLQKLNAVNAAYDKKIKLQSTSEVKNENQSQLEEARQKKDRANTQLELMRMAEEGDTGAIEAFKKNLSIKEVSTSFLEKLRDFKLIGKNKSSWEQMKVDYENQLSESDKIIKSRSVSDIRYSANQRSAEIEAYLSDKQRLISDMSPDQSKGFDKLSKSKQASLMQAYQKKLANFNGLYGDLSDVGGSIGKYGTIRGTRGGGKVDYGSQADKLISEIDSLFGTKSAPASGSGVGGTHGTLGSGVDNITGDDRIAKNLTININEMGNDWVINSSSVEESVPDMKKHLMDAFLSVVNDANGA